MVANLQTRAWLWNTSSSATFSAVYLNPRISFICRVARLYPLVVQHHWFRVKWLFDYRTTNQVCSIFTQPPRYKTTHLMCPVSTQPHCQALMHLSISTPSHCLALIHLSSWWLWLILEYLSWQSSPQPGADYEQHASTEENGNCSWYVCIFICILVTPADKNGTLYSSVPMTVDKSPLSCYWKWEIIMLVCCICR